MATQALVFSPSRIICKGLDKDFAAECFMSVVLHTHVSMYGRYDKTRSADLPPHHPAKVTAQNRRTRSFARLGYLPLLALVLVLVSSSSPGSPTFVPSS